MEIKLGGLGLDQDGCSSEPSTMNIRLRQMRCNGGNCGGLTLLSPGYLCWLFMNKKNKLTTRERLAQWGYTGGCLSMFWVLLLSFHSYGINMLVDGVNIVLNVILMNITF